MARVERKRKKNKELAKGNLKYIWDMGRYLALTQYMDKESLQLKQKPD